MKYLLSSVLVVGIAAFVFNNRPASTQIPPSCPNYWVNPKTGLSECLSFVSPSASSTFTPNSSIVSNSVPLSNPYFTAPDSPSSSGDFIDETLQRAGYRK